ncbi:uncharacterized mitochondrial protein AtMg00810-like [Vicia villosa]|uniref:uncharacterized mitochondrial protein AtMg00810-like n=1 Tax=Vicia villosa TaxID=3911 RepID=UPI00273A75DD|nr:uncharacterized mitochondrial protein AtMg00810-like [Vicia villosa]
MGIVVSSHPSGIFLSQRTYASKFMEHDGMTSCKLLATLVNTKQKHSTSYDTPYKDPSLYQSLTGAIQYFTFTRPEISYAVQQVCLHMHAPSTQYMFALKFILCYVQGIIHFGLHLSSSLITKLISYTDADWGGCLDTKCSIFEYYIFLSGNLIYGSSKSQLAFSRFTSEVEYRSVANVVSELCWICNLLFELYFLIPHVTLVYCDNVSATYQSGNPVHH